jgi:LacI family transcriptional regulator
VTRTPRLCAALRKTQTIGLVLEDVSNPFSSELHRAVEDAARERGVLVFAGSCDEDPERERDLIGRSASDASTGSSSCLRATITPTCTRSGVPGRRSCSSIARPVTLTPTALSRTTSAEPPKPSSTSSNAGIGAIGFLGDLLSISTAEERLRGYTHALESAGIPLDDDVVRTELRDPDAAARAVDEMLALPDPPTAFFTGQNLLTIGGVHALRRAGRERDIALIGFDDISLADLLDPAISSLRRTRRHSAAPPPISSFAVSTATPRLPCIGSSRQPDRARLRRDSAEELGSFVIVIGGEALVDLVDDGGTPRSVAGGGPFNTGDRVRPPWRPGRIPWTISRDGDGQMLAKRLLDAGVDTSFVRLPTLRPPAVVHHLGDGRNEYTFHLNGPPSPTFPRTSCPFCLERAVYVGRSHLRSIRPRLPTSARRPRSRARRSFRSHMRPRSSDDADVDRRRFDDWYARHMSTE